MKGQQTFHRISEGDRARRPWRGSLVAAEPEYPLQAERADAVLLAGHEPHHQEPGPERLARAIEKSASSERGAAVTTPAAQQLVRHRPVHRSPRNMGRRSPRASADAECKPGKQRRPGTTGPALETDADSRPLRSGAKHSSYGRVTRRLRSVKGIPTITDREHPLPPCACGPTNPRAACHGHCTRYGL